MKNTKPTDGFALVEMLIVIAVMGIILMPVATAFTQSLRAIRASKSRQTAAMLGQQCLELMRSTVKYNILPEDGRSIRCDGSDIGGGPYSFGEPHETYDYTTSVKQVENTGGDLPLKMIRIRVIYPAVFHDGTRCISTVDCGSSDWDYTSFLAKR